MLACSVRTLQDGGVVTLGVKCLRHPEMLFPVVSLPWRRTGSDEATILISKYAKSTQYASRDRTKAWRARLEVWGP